MGGFAFVLQDWASEEGLRACDPDVQAYGPGLLTNRRLEALLAQVLGISVTEVYVTNAFPFVKQGGNVGGAASPRCP